MTPLSLVFVVAIAGALAWKYYQVAQAPRDLPLRAVTLCLTCAAIAFPFGLSSVAERCDEVLGVGFSKLAQNVLLLCTVYWLMCFYLYSAGNGRRERVRARWEAVWLTVSVALLVLSTVITADEPGERTYEAVDMQVPGFALFYFVGGGYLVYALAAALRWTVPYARASYRPLSTGLWMVAGSMAGMVLAGSVRLVVVVIRWQGGSVPSALPGSASIVLSLVIPLFVIGVSYPGLATRLVALRIWRQHRRVYRRLLPLWLLLHEAYPQDELSRVPTGRWRDRLLLRGVHRRYYRRVIECRDGLVRISPHLARIDTADPQRSAPERGSEGAGEAPSEPAGESRSGGGDHDQAPPLPGSSPVELASRLRAALAAQAAGDTATTQAIPVAVPESDSLDADVRQLVALADALRAT